jgi:hypothetical protein
MKVYETLIGFILLSALVLIPNINRCVTTSSRTRSAENNARAFAEKLQLGAIGALCSGSDSDGDGYVSCTLKLEDGAVQSLEFGYNKLFAPFGQNTECKQAFILRGTHELAK